MRSSDLVRAARLDGTLYEGAKADTTATGPALGIVALVALAHGAGGVVRRWPSGGTLRRRAS